MKYNCRWFRIFMVTTLACVFCTLSGLAAESDPVEGGIRFASYELTTDHRTGINLTPEAGIKIGRYFEMNFHLSFRRLHTAYGHIFRIIDQSGVNIDLVSSPNSPNLEDLNLVIGDSAVVVSYTFEEIELQENKWFDVKLIIDQKTNYIGLSINNIEKSALIKPSLELIDIVFGKADLGRYSTSDVPPIAVKNIIIKNQKRIIRNWPLVRYRDNYSLDTTGGHKAEATNPNWIIDDHIKWQRLGSVRTAKRPQIVYDYEDNIYLLLNDSLLNISLDSGAVTRKSLLNNANLPFGQASQLIPGKDEIWVFDLDSFVVNKLSLEELTWTEVNSTFSVPTSHYHTSKLRRDNGSSLFFGGYGHYQYQNELLQYNGNQWQIDTIPGIEPRYLAAIGELTDGEILIFGGYGSMSGSQEIGPRPFYQLHKLDPESGSSKKLWEMEITDRDDVFSNSLIPAFNDSIFYVLRHSKDKYQCKVYLDSYSVDGSEKITFTDSLDFLFHDIFSYAELYYNENRDKLVAVLMSKQDDEFITDLYTLKAPPMTAAQATYAPLPARVGKYVYISLGGIGLLLLAGFIYNRYGTKQTKPKPAPTPQDVHLPENGQMTAEREPVDQKSMINLMGGFQVIDASGKDISHLFTGTLRSLLSLILLHSAHNGKGVPNNIIWETIWDHKTEKQARNNRNVNIKKLRTLLKSVGEVEIKIVSDKWVVQFEEKVFFDYGYLQKLLDTDVILPKESLKIVAKGNLLPTIEEEWVDEFKAQLSNKLVDKLLAMSKEYPYDDKIQIEIANAIFKYDVIDQDALKIKLRCLNANHKFALARQCYDSYSKEFKVLYDRDFDLSFEEMLMEE